MRAWRFASCALLLGCLLSGQPGLVHAQQQASIDTTSSSDPEDEQPKRRLVKWNQYDGPVTTARFGFGFLTDYATYKQDDQSEQQFDMERGIAVRDFRLLLNGKFKTSRPITWSIGYMYDGVDDQWRWRQTGVNFGLPEISSKLFLGRTKEGYSMVKVMTGYHPWGMERQPALDFVPILADGAKLMTYLEKPRIYTSVGFFSDFLGENEKFMTADETVSGRVVWQPVLSDEKATVLHLGLNARTIHPDNEIVQLKSKPEDNQSPFFLDTGKIPSKSAQTFGPEAYYRKGSWLFGSEWLWEKVHAEPSGDPTFMGGNFVVVWNISGETRAYNPSGAFFAPVSPKKSMFDGGTGAFEALLTWSYEDYNSGPYQGGKLWRITPMVNWYLSDNLRVEFNYGYSKLDRFGLKGGTNFFQARTQITL